MQHSRRISGLVFANVFGLIGASLVCCALVAIIAIKWVGFAPVLLVVAILAAIAAIAATVEWMLRKLSINEVKRDFQDINAAVGVLKDLGNNAMSPAVLKKFKWSVEEVLKGIVEQRDLEEWHHLYRSALWLHAGFAVAVAGVVGGVLAVCHIEMGAWWHWGLFALALLPVVQLIFGLRKLPSMDVASPEELAGIIFEVIVRLNDPKMAVKNGLTSLVDVGVDGLSEVVSRKIVAWATDAPNLNRGSCACACHAQ